MNSGDKYRLISASVTLLIAVVALVTLMFVRLGFSSGATDSWPPVDSTAILLAEEYVEVEMPPVVTRRGGDSNSDNGATPPPPDAVDLRDAGVPAEETTPPITSPRPSDVIEKQRQPQTPTGPSQEELDRRAEEKRRKEASDEAKNRIKFGKTPAADGSGDGATGSSDGSADSKGRHRGSGTGNVGGRGVSVPGGISCPVPGVVTVRISVNPQGQVTAAEIIQPTTISDPTVRAQCITRARSAKVAPAPDKTADEIGRITFSFK